MSQENLCGANLFYSTVGCTKDAFLPDMTRQRIRIVYKSGSINMFHLMLQLNAKERRTSVSLEEQQQYVEDGNKCSCCDTAACDCVTHESHVWKYFAFQVDHQGTFQTKALPT